MKNHIILFIALPLFLLSSCQDVIDLDVPDGDILLVVDGWLTDQEGPQTVLLSTTANYFNNTTTPTVNGALVLLYNEQGLVDTLLETDPGKYVTSYTGVIGETYWLYIRTVDGAAYESNPETLRPVPEIDKVEARFKEETAFFDAGYYVYIDTYEPFGTGDHYRWKQYVNDEYQNEPFDLLYATDEFVDGNPIIDFEVTTNEPLESGDHYRIQQLSISQAAFDFFTQLQTQTAFVGSLFDSPPASLQGNIHTLDPTGKKALGFFGVSAVSEKELIVEQ